MTRTNQVCLIEQYCCSYFIHFSGEDWDELERKAARCMSYYLSFPSLILMLFVADKKKTEMNGHGGSDSDSDRPKKKKAPAKGKPNGKGKR